MDVRHYEARHLLELFPTIEHDLLLGWADMVAADPLGRTPHDAGSPVDDPWFVVSQYSATRPGEPPLRVDWLDLPPKFVQQAHAYWTYTGDDAFGAEVYPALVKTMTHLLSLDLDGDGIPDAHGFCTTYDAIEMDGAASYVAALFIGACDAMADFAVVFDTDAAQAQWSKAAATARATAEASLWIAERRVSTASTRAGPSATALLADALCGQRYAARDGLPDVLDPQRMASHLSQAYRLNVLGRGRRPDGGDQRRGSLGSAHRHRAGEERCGPAARTSPPRSCTPWGRPIGRLRPRRQRPHHGIRRVPHHLRRRPHRVLVRHPRPVDSRRRPRQPAAVPGRGIPAMPGGVGAARGDQGPVPGGLEALGVTRGLEWSPPGAAGAP